MSQNGQTRLNNLVANATEILKVCLTISGHYIFKVLKVKNKETVYLVFLFLTSYCNSIL